MAEAKAAEKKPTMVKPKTNMLEDFMLGGVSAAVSKTVAAPIERIKLLLQNQGEATSITKPYTGIMDCLVRVPKEQGIGAFWRGNFSNVLRYFPTQALNFMFKDAIKKLFDAKPSEPFLKRLYVNVASGGAAGALSLAVVYPLDFARTRLAMDTGVGAAREFNGTFDCIMKTARTSGWSKGGVYNGFTVSVVGIIGYRGAYFGIFDTVKDSPIMKNAGFIQKFCLGYAVTVVAGLISYPLDTIRRRMMMTSGKSKKGGEGIKYKSSIDCFQQIVKSEGMGALFKGAGSNILRGLCGALVLVGFDYCQDMYIDFRYGEGASKGRPRAAGG